MKGCLKGNRTQKVSSEPVERNGHENVTHCQSWLAAVDQPYKDKNNCWRPMWMIIVILKVTFFAP